MAKALTANTTRDAYRPVSTLMVEPTEDTFVSNAGHISSKIKVLPYCGGPPGSAFSMRVYGYERYTSTVATKGVTTLLPILLAEFSCVAGSV